MKRMIEFCTIFLVLFVIGTTSAKTQDHGGSHGAAAPASDPHATMTMETGGAMIMLDTVTTDGIKAMAHLQALTAPAAAPDATHAFMVSFEDTHAGGALTTGRAAVKITTPDGQTGPAISLVPENGFFKATISMKSKGKYAFVVGAKLTDGKATQFSFSHELK